MVGYLGESHAPQDCPVSGPGLTQTEPDIHQSTQNQDRNDLYTSKRRYFIKVSLAEWLWRVTQAILPKSFSIITIESFLMGFARKGSNPLADSIFFAFLLAWHHGGWVGRLGRGGLGARTWDGFCVRA